MFHYAVDTFIDLLQQVTKRRRIDYKCNVNDKVSFDIFLYEFGVGIGEDFIRKFILYGIQSWFNSGSEIDNSYSIRFSWVIGGNAIKRWRKLGMEKNMSIVRSCLKKRYKIKIKFNSNMKNIVLSVRDAEEKFKSEFHNTKRGFLWCVANTTLYYHKSSYCATCTFKQKCKEMLKENYITIYKARGYDKQ